MEVRLMILTVTAPEPSEWAEEGRKGQVEVEGVGRKGRRERVVIVRGSS